MKLSMSDESMKHCEMILQWNALCARSTCEIILPTWMSNTSVKRFMREKYLWNYIIYMIEWGISETLYMREALMKLSMSVVSVKHYAWEAIAKLIMSDDPIKHFMYEIHLWNYGWAIHRWNTLYVRSTCEIIFSTWMSNASVKHLICELHLWN